MLHQLDYISFLCGFSFLLLVTMLWELQPRAADNLPWRWLAAFGLLYGAGEWLEMLAFDLEVTPVFHALGLALLATSFLLLLEFSRRGWQVQGGRVIGWWVYPPLLGLAGLGVLAGMNGLNATIRYALGLPGGLLAAGVLWRATWRLDTRQRWPFGLIALALLVYGPATGLSAPYAAFFPAATLNHDTFLAVAGFPLQLIQTLCALTAATGAWMAYRQPGNTVVHPGGLQRWSISVAIVALLAGGAWAANWRGQLADMEMRSRLLSQAKEIAQAIDPDAIMALSFTAADKTNVQFQRLRSQMIAYGQSTLSRYGGTVRYFSIYSMAIRDGSIIFGPENIDEQDPTASPPGTVYEHPPAQVRAAFQTRQPQTAGPYTDEYGTFVSGFAPVLAPRSGEVLLVVGLDLMADQWQAQIARQRLIPILFTAAIILILLVGSSALHWRERQSPVRQRWLWQIETLLTAACGLVLTAGLAFLAQNGETRSLREIFLLLAQGQAVSVEEAIQDIKDQLAALARLCEDNPQLTRATFQAYAGPLTTITAVQALEWIPRVPAVERDKIELEAFQQGLQHFTLFEKDSHGDKIPLTGRPVYYPVLFVEPLAGNEGAVGYDLNSEPVRRTALEAAARTGLSTATDPLIFVQETGRPAIPALMHRRQ